MFTSPDRTHDPSRLSWIESANQPLVDFPLQNLPLGVFGHAADPSLRLGVAIGDMVLDLRSVARGGLLEDDLLATACQGDSLNGLMALGIADRRQLRRRLSELLGADSCPATLRTQLQPSLIPQTEARMALPAQIGGYTDFYASIHHASNVGALFRPDQPLLPNYKWVPIGYHGRTSSIVPSGTPVVRPCGQVKGSAASPAFRPSQQLDYEVELGALVGSGNTLGEPVPLGRAHDHLFGVSLLNDWSARDIQSWEYQPLGPFLAKNFATSLSPWVVTMEALAPFRCPRTRSVDDPAPLDYLQDAQDTAQGGLEIILEAWLQTPRMLAAKDQPHLLSRGNFREMYWTFGQMLAHHTSNGCNLRTGDLLGSGTVSGPEPSARGCLLELTRRGTEPLRLPNGESRGFLEDGDTVILRGYAERPGYRRIGFGECRGSVVPARA